LQTSKLDDRYAFVVEWFDKSAQMAKEFRLFFYADDNSVEMVLLRVYS
jgi:hypothetical protein